MQKNFFDFLTWIQCSRLGIFGPSSFDFLASIQCSRLRIFGPYFLNPLFMENRKILSYFYFY